MADPGDLRRGIRGAGGTRIRLRRPSDDPGLLLGFYQEAVGQDLPLDHPLLAGDSPTALDAGARGGPAAVVDQLTGRNQFEVYDAYCATMVAESGQAVVGAVFLAPPLQLLDGRDDVDAEMAFRVLMSVIKLTAISVLPSHRGRGIGASLVKQARAACLRCGTAVMYGEFDGRDEALARFYTNAGFELLGRQDVVDLSPIAGAPFYIREGDGNDLLFARRVSPAYSFAVRRSGVVPES